MEHRYTLHSVHEHGEPQFVTYTDSKLAAQFAVERMENAGTWPEGCNAILTRNHDGKQWMYTDGWEAV